MKFKPYLGQPFLLSHECDDKENKNHTVTVFFVYESIILNDTIRPSKGATIINGTLWCESLSLYLFKSID